jgi:hypothetical protein
MVLPSWNSCHDFVFIVGRAFYSASVFSKLPAKSTLVLVALKQLSISLWW